MDLLAPEFERRNLELSGVEWNVASKKTGFPRETAEAGLARLPAPVQGLENVE